MEDERDHRACQIVLVAEVLSFHSSTDVAGDRTASLVPEEDLEAGSDFRRTSPRLAPGRKGRARGEGSVPIAVVRPATLVGDSTTGEIDRFDGPYLLILLIVIRPPTSRCRCPVAVTRRFTSYRSTTSCARRTRSAAIRAAVGRTFHIVDPSPSPRRRIVRARRARGGRRSPRGFIPTNLTKALLRTPGLERFAKSPRAFVDQLATPVRFDARNTDEILAGTGIVPARPSRPTSINSSNYVRDRVREKRERREQRPAEIEMRSTKSVFSHPVAAGVFGAVLRELGHAARVSLRPDEQSRTKLRRTCEPSGVS